MSKTGWDTVSASDSTCCANTKSGEGGPSGRNDSIPGYGVGGYTTEKSEFSSTVVGGDGGGDEGGDKGGGDSTAWELLLWELT
jgi:hypothetical protein